MDMAEILNQEVEHPPEPDISHLIWKGVYQDVEDRWLRFTDPDGNLGLTGVDRG